EQMHLRSELLFGGDPGSVTVLTHHNRTAETARNEQRLVAEVLGRALRIDECNSASATAIATGKDVESDATGLQHFTKENYEGSFAGAADRQVADADGRSSKALGTQETTVIKGVAGAHSCAEQECDRAHDPGPPESV